MTTQKKVDDLKRQVERKLGDLRSARDALVRIADEMRELDNQLYDAQMAAHKSHAAQREETGPREWHGCIDPMGHRFREGECQNVGCEFDMDKYAGGLV